MNIKLKYTISTYIFLASLTYTYASEVKAETLKFKSLKASRTNEAPTIDGKIDDEVWSKAEPLDDFIQFEPYNLSPASVKTEVRVLYDDNNIYIAFENFDPETHLTQGRPGWPRLRAWSAGFEKNFPKFFFQNFLK